MAARNNIHVTENGGKWEVKLAGMDKPLGVHPTQAYAISHGKELASGLGTALHIYRTNGQLAKRIDYENVPSSPYG
ncbi:MAG: DUF2188 domain-containing protein [Gemmatimonadota bacterium]|nr:DUF2188 domain-containing protein [Gemmatimonadota bacterium]